MVDVIDQSWVSEWVSKVASPQEARTCREWLHSLPPAQHALLQQFPPLCLVQGRRPLEVPYVFTVGIVVGYEPDGTLHVRQTPEDSSVLVSAEDLKVVGYWRGLSPEVVRKILSKRKSHDRHP